MRSTTHELLLLPCQAPEALFAGLLIQTWARTPGGPFCRCRYFGRGVDMPFCERNQLARLFIISLQIPCGLIFLPRFDEMRNPLVSGVGWKRAREEDRIQWKSSVGKALDIADALQFDVGDVAHDNSHSFFLSCREVVLCVGSTTEVEGVACCMWRRSDDSADRIPMCGHKTPFRPQ
jgi:hypothetical protein